MRPKPNWCLLASLAPLGLSVPGGSPALEPCPEDANLWACAAWCERVAPGSSGTFGGKVCAHLEAHERAQGVGPSCTCYDANYEQVLQECRSRCPDPSEEQSASSEGEDADEVCPAGDASCHKGLPDIQQLQGSLRFLLYDVKMGEGFNLQREVFPRVGWVAWRLNQKVLDRCGGNFSTGDCAEWALVLPPWCRVVHWWSDSRPVPWRAFFDEQALRSPSIRIMEFDEYSSLVGGPLVDLAVTITEDRIPKDQRRGRQDGGFGGWASKREACRDVAAHSWSEADKRWMVTYSGECDGGIRARDYRCAALSSGLPRDFVDLLSASSKIAMSVLVKRADSMSPPGAGELDDLGLRESMLFAEPIRRAGEDFMASHMAGAPYLAVHCRRTDFLHARADTTPEPEAIAFQINSVLEERGLTQVFVATDAPSDLRVALSSQVQGKVHFLDGSEEARRLSHPGQQAAVEMWVAARAAFFLGTQDSRFTSHIQLERSWLGKPQETSSRELCKHAAPRGPPCVAPTYRHAKKRGSQHQAYWEL